MKAILTFLVIRHLTFSLWDPNSFHIFFARLWPSADFDLNKKMYFVAKIVLKYCENIALVIEGNV